MFKIIAFFTPPNLGDEEKTPIARRLHVIILALMAAALIAIVLHFFTNQVPVSIAFSVGLFPLFIAYLLNRGGRTKFASQILVIMFWALTTFMVANGDGLQDIAILMFPVVILTSALLLDSWSMIITVAVSIFSLGLITVGQFQGWVNNLGKAPVFLMTDFISAVLIVGMAATVSYLLINNLRRSILKARQNQHALAESEERYRNLFLNAQVGIYRTTPDGRILAANPALVKLMGFESFEELSIHNVEKDSLTFFPPREEFKQSLEEKGTILGLETVWIRKDQSLLHLRENAQMLEDEDGSIFYEGTVEDISAQINARDLLEKSNEELIQAYDATLEGWSRALELREKETAGHSQRVMEITHTLANNLGISQEDWAHMRRGTLLHDIGKMVVPDSILHKPGTLNEEEWHIMRQHPEYAHAMLSPISYLLPALDIPYCHHERWDGSGYPRGLIGKQIPLAARIFAVVDVWDALTSDRPYRPAWSKSHARQYIKEKADILFDPQVVAAFLQILEIEQ